MTMSMSIMIPAAAIIATAWTVVTTTITTTMMMTKKKEGNPLIPIAISTVLFIGGLFLPEGSLWFWLVFIAAYLAVGYKVLIHAVKNILHGKVFDENFLMALASVGAMSMGDAKEAVAVMLFYQVGEWFQDRAVAKSRDSIAHLMDIRPDHADLVKEDGSIVYYLPGRGRQGRCDSGKTRRAYPAGWRCDRGNLFPEYRRADRRVRSP